MEFFFKNQCYCIFGERKDQITGHVSLFHTLDVLISEQSIELSACLKTYDTVIKLFKPSSAVYYHLS